MKQNTKRHGETECLHVYIQTALIQKIKSLKYSILLSLTYLSIALIMWIITDEKAISIIKKILLSWTY